MDEVGELNQGHDELSSVAPATLLISDLMREMDIAEGKLVFIFAHISQEVLNKQATGSGRQVMPLGLAALPVNVWARALEEREPRLKAAAAQHPQLHQLLLSLCGHRDRYSMAW